MKVRPKRASTRLLRELQDFLGEGIHTMFRKFLDHREAVTAHRAIRDMGPQDWADISAACAATTITWVFKHEALNNNQTERDRLSFNLAKKFVKKARELSQRHPGAKGTPSQRLYAALDAIGFRNYRASFSVVADEVIRMMIQPEDKCGSCRYSREHDRRCETCQQFKCAVHCCCVTGARRAGPKRKASRR